MSRPNASRWQLFGAGAALLLLAPAAIGTTKAAEIDGELLRLCAELDQHQAAIDRIEADPNSGPDLAEWWAVLDRLSGYQRAPQKAYGPRLGPCGLRWSAPMVTRRQA